MQEEGGSDTTGVVSLEMMTSAEPHKYDPWWNNRFESGRELQLFIWLT